jgi:hypothetical protein
MLKARVFALLCLALASPLAAQDDEVIIQPLEADAPPDDPTRPLDLKFPPQLVLVEARQETAGPEGIDVSLKVAYAKTLGRDADGRSAWANLHMKIDGKTARAFDSDGNPIEPKHLPMRLAKPTRAVLFYGKIDPYYLGLYRKETVLFVIPEEILHAP